MIEILLADDFRQKEPLAYLVKNRTSCAHVNEYKIFSDLSKAIQLAEENETAEGEDWFIYALYDVFEFPISESSGTDAVTAFITGEKL